MLIRVDVLGEWYNIGLRSMFRNGSKDGSTLIDRQHRETEK